MFEYFIRILHSHTLIPSVVHAFNLSTFFGFILSEKKFIVFEKLCNVINLILR